MKHWKRWLLLPAVGIVGCGAAYLLFSIWFLDFFVNFWWFGSLDLRGYFVQRLMYRYLICAGIALIFFLIFLLNFRLCGRFMRKHKDPAQNSWGGGLYTGALKFYVPLSLILAIPLAIPAFEHWEKMLLFIFGPATGINDPAYGKDIGFYLFSLPVFELIQHELFLTFGLLFLLVGGLYWLHKRTSGESLGVGARLHVTLVYALMALLFAWGYMLDRYQLLYHTAHQPLFHGPGFVQMRYDLPLIWLAILFFLIAAMALAIYAHWRRGLAMVVFAGMCLALVTGLQHWDWPRRTLQKYSVSPNEVIKERDFIQKNIEATLAAYQLQDLELEPFDIQPPEQLVDNIHVKHMLANVPVWDRDLLDDVYTQLQGISPYYQFPSVDVDRYLVDGIEQQVYLAARELNLSDLPAYARNWTNRHLQYTHGYGVVMTPAAQGGDESMSWFVHNMPVSSDYGLPVPQPAIYYGFQPYDYALAPNLLGEIDYPGEDGNVMTNYAGTGGVPLTSVFRKLFFAIYFQDRNVFFTTKTTPQTRVLFRRDISESIQRITPFLTLDNDPYLVLTDTGFFWIQDAYTLSDYYPYAQTIDGKFNYIRNSIKIIIDAYNGDIIYYTSGNDPIAQAYDRMYPGLMRPMADMPAQLRKHLRYPKDLFEIQMHIFARYHQTHPESFYLQDDNWELSKSHQGGQAMNMRPYYLTLDDLNAEGGGFMLVVPLSPIERNNLRALAIAACDGDRYGKITVLSFPRGKQVYGPSQINSLVDQDTDISQQLTLWDQAGSEVRRGRIVILPVDDFLLYIQPVYLSSATRLKIPELKRLIVSDGEVAAMGLTLDIAISELEKKIKTRQLQRWPRRKRSILPSDGSDKIVRLPDATSSAVITSPETAPATQGAGAPGQTSNTE